MKEHSFVNGRVLIGEAFAQYWHDQLSVVDVNEVEEKVRRILEALLGSFAIAVRSEHQLMGVVDRVRSIPLFYGISDDQAWVNDEVIDPSFLNEFLLGTTTGPAKDGLVPENGSMCYLRPLAAGPAPSGLRHGRIGAPSWDIRSIIGTLFMAFGFPFKGH